MLCRYLEEKKIFKAVHFYSKKLWMKDPIYHQLAQSENIWNHFATLIFMNWIKKFNLHAFWFYEKKINSGIYSTLVLYNIAENWL